jgi:hypothetical protein
MPRIDDRTWEYTPEEQIIAEIVDLLTDQGMPQGDAVILIRGSRVPEGLRSKTPNLDRVLTPEFTEWLTE